MAVSLVRMRASYTFSRNTFFCTLPIALRGSVAHHVNALGHLERRDLALQRADDRALVERRAAARDDHRDDRFAEIGSGTPMHRGFGDAGQAIEALLDLLRDRR
jgi:hypothetical protein